jgi:DNA modification methylase
VSIRILKGDCRQVLATLPAASVQCCVTSPPYFGLRNYGVEGQIGLEETPDAYVAEMVAVFREVRRVLKDDGTLWLNLGDSYVSNGRYDAAYEERVDRGRSADKYPAYDPRPAPKACGIKPKDLIGIPWMVAFALRADGWYLRKDIIWSKPNPMPESVTDRPTSSHEHVFLLSKAARYYYDADAIRQPLAESSVQRFAQDIEAQAGSERAHGGEKIMKAVCKGDKQRGHSRRRDGFNDRWDSVTKAEQMACGSNARDVWTIATQPFSGAHFATMPPELAERCIKAGTRPGDTVLDPFGGAGTTGLAADRLNRDAVLIELNPDYAALAKARVTDDCPMFAEVVA